MMKDILWILFIGSMVLLLVTLVRTRKPFQWIGYIGLNVVFAAFILYFINLTSVYTGFILPINIATVSTIGVLGIPGLLLLAAVKVVLI